MDSLTHIVLGAAIGDRMLGKRIGRKAAWIGALAKTFPDFDLFISGLSDQRKYILYHRSYTHSFFIELLTAFPLAYICYLLFKKKVEYKQWFLLWLVCMWAHSLLDLCTNYGTRALLPFYDLPISFNNIAIADLFFTVPMFLALIIALFCRNESRARKGWMRGLLAYCVLYLGMSFVNKVNANRMFNRSLKAQKIEQKAYMSNPTILNNILWYAVVNTDSTLMIGEVSLLNKYKPISWNTYPINRSLLDSCESPDARMLEWFSQGFYFVQRSNDTIDVYTPKFGRGNMDVSEARKTFLFYYQLYQEDGKWKMTAHQPDRSEMNFSEAFGQLIRKVKGE